jgi:hypothetical protein
MPGIAGPFAAGINSVKVSSKTIEKTLASPSNMREYVKY